VTANNEKAAEPADVVTQAMNRVLRAEHDADQAIAECEHEARRILQAAQTEARRIAERTNERITLMHMRCTHRLSNRLRELELAYHKQAQGQSQEQLSQQALADIIDEVAASLTGNGDPDSGDGQPTE
jgi:vacuolar-type H+-ATPase subunit H